MLKLDRLISETVRNEGSDTSNQGNSIVRTTRQPCEAFAMKAKRYGFSPPPASQPIRLRSHRKLLPCFAKDMSSFARQLVTVATAEKPCKEGTIERSVRHNSAFGKANGDSALFRIFPRARATPNTKETAHALSSHPLVNRKGEGS